MLPLSPETESELQSHLAAVAQILYAHTEPEKLQDFETIEWELRDQMLNQVSPRIGNFFLRRSTPPLRKAAHGE